MDKMLVENLLVELKSQTSCDRLLGIIDRIEGEVLKEGDFIFARSLNSKTSIRIHNSEIYKISSDGRYGTIYTSNNEIYMASRVSLSKIEAAWKGLFIRTGRSDLTNISFIKKLTKVENDHYIELTIDANPVKVSRRGAKDIRYLMEEKGSI